MTDYPARYIPRQNTVFVCDAYEKAASHIRELQDLATINEVSIVLTSCLECREIAGEAIVVCIVRRLLETVRSRNKIKWFRFITRIKYWQMNKEFNGLINSLEEWPTVEHLETTLASGHRIIKAQINRLVSKERTKFALFVINNFEHVDKAKQPVLAGILHRLVKGSPAYFRIVSVGAPHLFRKDDFGEVGVQLNHDYIMI